MAEVSDDSDYYYFDDEDYDLTQAELVEFTQNCPQLDDLDDKADFDETLSQHIQSTQVQLEEETDRGTQEENSCIQEETQPENTSRKRPRTENCAVVARIYAKLPGTTPFYDYRYFTVGESYFKVRKSPFHISNDDSKEKGWIYRIAKFEEKSHNENRNKDYNEVRNNVEYAYCFIFIPVETIPWIGDSSSLKESHVMLRCVQKVKLADLTFEVETSKTNLLYEPSSKASNGKGVGWQEAISFFDLSKGTPKEVTCNVTGDRAFVVDKEPTVFDCFAGAGGMSLGFIQAGFHVSHAIEKDPNAAATLKVNHTGGIVVYQEDVNDFLERIQDPSENEAYKLQEEINHVHCSSPCQGFSKANRTGGKNDDANNKLSLRFPELLNQLGANTGSFENVTGMLDENKIEFLQEMVDTLLLDDYQVRVGGAYELHWQ